MWDSPTTNTETVDAVMLYIVGLSVLLLIGITVVMIYFVFKYHRKHGHKPVDIHGSVILETIWIAIPTLLVLSMFYFGYIGFQQMRAIPDDAMEIEVTAKMWEWDFKYSNGMNTDSLFVPVGQPVKLVMESMDVNHSLFIPAFRMKEDVMPGTKTYLSFTADKPGEFDIACAEYCGLKHSMMYTKVIAMDKSEFDHWFGTETDSTISADLQEKVNSDIAKLDTSILNRKGCVTCHSLDGSDGLGPTFKNMYGKNVIVITDDGEKSVRVDDEYLKNAIIKPFDEIVKGYARIMPPSGSLLSDEELVEVIDVLKQLN